MLPNKHAQQEEQPRNKNPQTPNPDHQNTASSSLPSLNTPRTNCRSTFKPQIAKNLNMGKNTGGVVVMRAV
jgi:hypothetical protein